MPPPPAKREYVGGGAAGRGAEEPCQHIPLFSSKAAINCKDTGSLFLCRSNMGAKRSRSVGSWKGMEGGWDDFYRSKVERRPLLREEKIHPVRGDLLAPTSTD